MILTDFEKANIKRQLITNGKTYDIYREEKDEYGAYIGKINKVCSILGLYHVENSVYKVEVITDNTNNHTKSEPMLLIDYIDCKKINLRDLVKIAEKTYRIISFDDKGNLGVCVDCSLEVVLNGEF